ncbi:MAG: M23 family metallopeptidase [Hyphomonadaceae bacterium]
MKWTMRSLACAAALAIAPAAQALDLRIVPAGGVIVNQANARGWSDAVVAGVVIAAGPREAVEVRALRIELLRDEAVRETRVIGADALVEASVGLAGAGFPEAIAAQVLNREGLAGLFGRAMVLGSDASLSPNAALVAPPQYFAFTGEIDSVRVVLDYEMRGRARTQSAEAPARRHETPLRYTAPVRGLWTQQATPTLQSHHRLNASTEFAADFFRMNERGEIYGGDPLDPESAFGYGEPVYAAADGVVVHVVADETQDRAAMMRRADETPQQAGQRIGRYMMERLARDFRRAAGGNLIVIRHEADGVVEYSSYGHLRAGSVRVREGQSVRQGEEIAEVGDTGDSPAVHLHFQLNAGPDPFTSPSLPVRFTDLRPAAGNNELGRVVVAGPE